MILTKIQYFDKQVLNLQKYVCFTMRLNTHKSEVCKKTKGSDETGLLNRNKFLIEIQNNCPAIYHLSDEQKSAVAEVQAQIRRGE
jgi:hypothetical protein